MKVRVFLNWKERRKRNIFSTIPLRGYKNKCRRLENKPQNENLDYRKLSIGIKAAHEDDTLFEDYKEWKKDHPNYTNRSEEMIDANFRGKLKELDERRRASARSTGSKGTKK